MRKTLVTAGVTPVAFKHPRMTVDSSIAGQIERNSRPARLFAP